MPVKTSRAQLMKSYQKGKMYYFVATGERNAHGCQIVQDSQGIKHLLTGTDKVYSTGKTVRLEVKGYSHSTSQITGNYYLILSPKAKAPVSKKKEPFNGKYLFPPKKKKTGFSETFLKQKYQKGERYLFVITGESDNKGRQFVEDSFGIRHILTGTSSSYETGANVRCTVLNFSDCQHPITNNFYMMLTLPRIVNPDGKIAPKKYIRRPELWYAELQGFDRHKSGKPFTCSCCGLDFPGKMGVRVDIKDIYFCNSCARKIFEPRERNTEPKLIYTPMGNKR